MQAKRSRGLLIYVSLGILCAIVGISLGSSKRAVFTIGSLALLLFLFFLFVGLVRGVEDRTFFYLILAALVIRIALAVVLHNSSIVKEADALTYNAEASRLSLALLGTGPLFRTYATHAYGYVYFSSFIYAGFAANSLVLEFINCFVGVACGAYVYKIAMKIWEDRRAALVAASLALFMPGILVWSTLNLKDNWVNLLILIAIWRLILIRERGAKSTDLVVVAICIGALWTVRFYFSLLMAPLLLYAIGAGRRKSLVYLGILLLIVVLVFNYAFIGREIMGVKIGLEDISNRLSGLTSGGGSSTGGYYDVSTPSGAIAFLPRGLVLLFFSPFPWNAPTSTLYALTFPEMVFIYLLWPFIIVGIVRALKRKLVAIDIVFLFATSTSILYALMAGNIGTFYRARTPVMLLLFIFAAGGLLKVHQEKDQPERADVESAFVDECGGCIA